MDVSGWSKAIWGMSEQAVADAFQGKELGRSTESFGEPVKRTSTLSLSQINVEGLPFKIYFFFGESGLEGVLIKSLSEHQLECFMPLYLALVSAYDSEHYEQPDQYGVTMQWIFPITRVTLNKKDMRETLGLEFVSLSYDRNQAQDAPKFGV
jgi:hypothetical protein